MPRNKQPTYEQIKFLTDRGCDLNSAHRVVKTFMSAFGVKKADDLMKRFTSRNWAGSDIAEFCKNALWKKLDTPEGVFALEDELVEKGADSILAQKVLSKYYGQFSPDIFLTNMQLVMENGCTLDEVFMFAHVIIDADADLLRERFAKAKSLDLEVATVLRSFEEVDATELETNVAKLKEEQEKCLEKIQDIEEKAAEQIAKLLDKAMDCKKTASEHRQLIDLLRD